MGKKRFVRSKEDNIPVVSGKIMSPFKGISINGKKFSKGQYEDLCIQAAENIALASFNTTDDLIKLLTINGCYDTPFIINILSKLSESYEDRKLKEIDKMVISPVAAANVLGITLKQDIINSVLRIYSKQLVDTVEKIGTSKDVQEEEPEEKYEDEIILD